jgi:ATP-dependent helicase/nuclease subunit B
LVLGGLNEGTWPPSVETGPGSTGRCAPQLGLPQPERRIGLSAHDFVAALGAERVLLTRAEREGGAPTVPSRWLARLDALFGYEPGAKTAPPEYIQRGQHDYLAWADCARPSRRLPAVAASRTAAAPGGAADPALGLERRAMASRSLRTLCAAHPGLEALDPLEAELGAADRGSALHDALDEFLASPSVGPAAARRLAEFEALGEKHLGTLMTAPAERAFWWPRFLRLTRWFIATENARRRAGTRLLASETTGRLTVGPAQPAAHHRGARRSHRRDRDRRLGRDRLQDRSRADQPGARGAVRAAVAARGGDGRARRLQQDRRQGGGSASLILGRPMAWATAAR